jgi:hypothetical protein
MKKELLNFLIFGTLVAVLISCEKKFQSVNTKSTVLKSGSINPNFEKRWDILFFNSWDDVTDLSEFMEQSVIDHIESFEQINALTINRLLIPVFIDSTRGNEIEYTWESEIAVDSFERAIGWNQYQPLIDFETSNNFNSLRKKIFNLLYEDAYNDTPEKLTHSQRVALLSFPLENSLITLFNENGIIGVGDSLYKVLENNVWISCGLSQRITLENITINNFEQYLSNNNFNIYGSGGEKSNCYHNRKLHFDDRDNSNKFQLVGMMTVTNVPVVNGRFIKGKTNS